MQLRQDARASRDTSGFLRGVERKLAGQRWAPDSGLPALIRAVLHALADRLGGGERRRLVQLLPELVPTRAGEDALTFGFDELVARAARSSGAPEETVRVVTEAVFAELRQLIPAELDRSIASALPEDIFVVWNSSNREDALAPRTATPAPASPAPTASAAPELQTRHAVLEHVERNAELPEGISGAAAFVATLCLTLLGASGGDATFLRESLPSPLRDLLFRCAQEREEEPTAFTRAEFCEALAAELGVTTERAARIASVVFEGLQQHLPPEIARAVAERLPAPLRAC
ncbi:MAG TPA: DUF2267 domain-containing protein [Polyangiaceae bacterium]|nr:DUF2267 domain-containing protein [Polyangiaceae bacterium]